MLEDISTNGSYLTERNNLDISAEKPSLLTSEKQLVIKSRKETAIPTFDTIQIEDGEGKCGHW